MFEVLFSREEITSNASGGEVYIMEVSGVVEYMTDVGVDGSFVEGAGPSFNNSCTMSSDLILNCLNCLSDRLFRSGNKLRRNILRQLSCASLPFFSWIYAKTALSTSSCSSLHFLFFLFFLTE